MIDILFVCDASPACGFGHAARCARIGRLVRERKPDAIIAFQGEFTSGARGRILEILPGVALHAPGAGIPAAVALIDRMADPLDADAWDPELLRRLGNCCGRVIHLASGIIAPRLPSGVFCIGYQPGGQAGNAPDILWGLRYAPASVSGKDLGDPAGESDRAFVAIGGASDATALRVVFEALATEPRIRFVDLLLSPVRTGDESAVIDGSEGKFDLTVHDNVASVTPLLARAGLVVASQGNLGYEAMALARPVVLIGLKRFQTDIAERLATAGLVVNGGQPESGTAASLGRAVARALDDAATLADNCRKAVDGRGLQRIADILLPAAQEAA